MIYKWNGKAFEAVQAILTHGARDWESFVIKGQTYLVVANQDNDVSRNIDSAIYKWNDKSFTEIQRIRTYGARDWESFQIDGTTYLVVANNQERAESAVEKKSRLVDSKIYKWDGRSFVEFQIIPTRGAHDWEHFVLDGQTYLIVANNTEGSTRTTDSLIYRWNGKRFVQVSALLTQGVRDCESFKIGAKRILPSPMMIKNTRETSCRKSIG